MPEKLKTHFEVVLSQKGIPCGLKTKNTAKTAKIKLEKATGLYFEIREVAD